MEIDPVLKKSIIASVIAAILILVFINPLLNLSWKLILFLSKYLYEGYLNSIYKSAALGETERISFLILFFLIFAISIGWIIWCKIGWDQYKGFKERLSDSGKAKKLNENQIEEETIKVKEELAKLLITFKKTSIATIFVTAVVVFSLFSILLKEFGIFQVNASFQQNLTVLTPKITEQERRELLAEWASMKSRTDYLKIKKQLQKIASEKNVILLESLLD